MAVWGGGTVWPFLRLEGGKTLVRPLHSDSERNGVSSSLDLTDQTERSLQVVNGFFHPV